MTPSFTFRRVYDSAYDTDFWFSPSHSDSDSVASENQPLSIISIREGKGLYENMVNLTLMFTQL